MADARRCLCLIDVQNDFVLPTGGLSVPNGADIIPVINHVRRTRQFDLVVICLDWHPFDHYFGSGAPGYAPYAQIGPQTIWPDHAYQDSVGAAVHPDLHVEPTDVVVRCGLSPLTDSYSAFRDNDRSTVSPLLEVRDPPGRGEGVAHQPGRRRPLAAQSFLPVRGLWSAAVVPCPVARHLHPPFTRPPSPLTPIPPPPFPRPA